MYVAPVLGDAADSPLPLVVDLDRTLLKTDTLIEQFLELLFRSPVVAAQALASISQGKAGFKRRVIDGAPINVGGLIFGSGALLLRLWLSGPDQSRLQQI